jgi:hypothetical protein
MKETRMSYGEQAVGLNPDEGPEVAELKRKFAGIIDDLHALRSDSGHCPEKARLCSIAITDAQTAQLWAVKALTWDEGA